MPLIKFTTAQGDVHEVDVPVGASVMDAAMNNNIPGITAECGGACACGTCHVYVESGGDTLPAPDDMETDMVEFAWEPKENSRLSCQIKVTEDMDGISFIIPAQQA